jgi:hypothetical protein
MGHTQNSTNMDTVTQIFHNPHLLRLGKNTRLKSRKAMTLNFITVRNVG